MPVHENTQLVMRAAPPAVALELEVLFVETTQSAFAIVVKRFPDRPEAVNLISRKYQDDALPVSV